MRPLVYSLLLIFFVLRFDLWWLDDRSFVFGLPIGLTYHLFYCLAAVGVMALVVRYGWPRDVELIDDPERLDS